MQNTSIPVTGAMRPLIERLRGAGIGITSGYKHINAGALRVIKIGRRSYVTDEAWADFIRNLPSYTPRSKAAATRQAA
jgi:hypothetical protein